jgi:hypothetical protein
VNCRRWPDIAVQQSHAAADFDDVIARCRHRNWAKHGFTGSRLMAGVRLCQQQLHEGATLLANTH